VSILVKTTWSAGAHNLDPIEERSVREIRGYWSSTSSRTAVLVTIIHANKKLAPVQAELIKAATIIVPALGI
jgi:hypothetical protein